SPRQHLQYPRAQVYRPRDRPTSFSASSSDRPYSHSLPTRRSSDLPTGARGRRRGWSPSGAGGTRRPPPVPARTPATTRRGGTPRDRKSTRLNSSHVEISYAVFCLKKKKKTAT